MALQYAEAKRKLNFQESKPEVTVEAAQRGETVTAQELIHQIHLNTLLPKGVIETVINAMTDSIQTYFTNGHGVYVGRSGKVEEGLGILYPTLARTKVKVAQLNADGSEKKGSDGKTIYDLKTNLSVGVGFRPSTAFKQMLSTISVQDITPKSKSTGTGTDTDGDADDTPTPPTTDLGD